MATAPPDGARHPFRRVGPDRLASPVILSVPHAGRCYTESLLAAARVSPEQLTALEDRLVDRLVWRAIAEGATALIADAPRAEIDLNRDEREMDPLAIAPPLPPSSFIQSARTRSGLGIIPSRLPLAGAIWRHRLTLGELERRLDTIYRPFHAALATLLDEALAAFGVAILLDCHSMPPRKGPDTARIVIGDRHGSSAAAHYRDAAYAAVAASGFSVAVNHPYAGGHITAAHGHPDTGIHALQIEIDRSLYLDSALREAGPGFDRVARLVASVSAALCDAAGSTVALAAE